MKTYLQILQLHAKVKDISYPNNLIKQDVKLPSVLWKNTLDDTTGNFWSCIFRKEDNGELGYEDNCVHFQLYFLINSMAYFYNESLEKQISRKHLLMGQAVVNMFLSNDVKAKLKDIFQKTQRTYLAFLRFANIVRHKIKKEKIDFDLRMEPIDIRSKFSISLIHNGAKYYFALTDLVNIIQTAITHSDDMFENPLFPKNPYNNLPFTKTQLYNIYFRIKAVFLNVPEWIQLFYKNDFDLDIFKIENEQKLRETYIKNYANSASINILYGEINSMISCHKRIFRRIRINLDFPKKELVDIFRPYLFLYIMSIDGIEGIEKKHLSRIILKKKLAEFVLFNENFGRKIVGYRDGRRIITFNTKHPQFTFKDACESFDKKKIFKISSRAVIEAPRNIIASSESIDSYEDDDNDNDSIVSSDEESSREEEFVYNYEYNPIPITDAVRMDIYNELNDLVRGPIETSTLQPPAAEGDLADEIIVNDHDYFS